MKPDQERVKNLLADTVTLLCKNGLNFRKDLKIQGVLGITLDDDDVFIVHINERLTAAEDVTATQVVQKNATELAGLVNSNEKTIPCGQNLAEESSEKSVHNESAFSSLQSSVTTQSDPASNSDVACAVVKIEKVENAPSDDHDIPYDDMVDFASFLPDFSSRYTSDLSSLHHSSLPLSSTTNVHNYPKRKRNSGRQLEKLPFLPNSTEGECSDSQLINDPSAPGSMPVTSFHGGHSKIRRSSASSMSKTSEMMLDQQNVVEISSGLSDDYSRVVASSYFGVGVDCGNQSSQRYDSSQQFAPFQWKRRSQHSQEKPFSCTVPGCGRTYWNQAHLSRHRVKHHGIYKRLFRKPSHENLTGSVL